ncbi:hypothetical protein ACFYZ2_13870 [Streptomyces sviceus]|uniref:hypothetical protein n=1 Tax=Streptomyces sviceus TaxID=285530 RepID=UPI0036A3E42F
MSYVAVTLAGADTPGEHLQLAAFTAMAAVFFIWLGRRQLSTGRHALVHNETMRSADRLIPPPPPSRGYRTGGRVYIVVGCVFLLPAVFNIVFAILGVVG